jgi:predicted lysophospholipase L1 biosynthesis ABC-type transport system permease subunit
VTPGFFRTIGVPVLEGRDFTERDDASAPPVVIVNRAFAERFFPGENALGKRIRPGPVADERGPQMREIAGIVGNAVLLGSFAAIALLLTVVGLYGLLASAVVLRTHEIGVRVALGATRQQVLGIVLRKAMLLVLLGIVIGTAGAFAGNQLLRTTLGGAAPHNPLLITVACLVLALTGMTSAYWPARRAASIDPIQALRAD